MKRSRVQSFIAGLLIANSSPHLATALTGRRHLTPLAGRRSGPVVNAVWAGLNLAGGAVLLRRSQRNNDTGARWDRDLTAFETGCVVFATWMAVTERLMPVNSDRPAGD